MDGWLQTFAVAFLGVLPESERSAAHAEALTMLAPVLRDELGQWMIDRMRLRLFARRPAEERGPDRAGGSAADR